MNIELSEKSYNASEAIYSSKSQKIIFQKPLQNSVYDIYISGPIGSPEQYIDVIHLIQSTLEGDTINLHINSPGGNVATTIQLRTALLNTDATVIASVEGECHSAATILMLSADLIEIAPHTSFMVHNYSSSAFGKGGELYERIEHLNNWSYEFFKDVYKDFLTENELQDIVKGKDLWMTAKEVQERLERILKKREEEAKTEEEKALEENKNSKKKNTANDRKV